MKFYARVETQFKQALRESALTDAEAIDSATVIATANLLVAVVAGRLDQCVRSDFKASPTADWDNQWRLLCAGLFPAA